MSSFRLNNGFRLQKTNGAAIRWKQPPKKPFHRVSRDKKLDDSGSISAALARGFSDRHFERGEGPGDKVGQGEQRPMVRSCKLQKLKEVAHDQIIPRCVEKAK